ncbi:N-acyl homoserine lactonase family protein [Bordetella genomosp. 11]|uniref:MBL fold hydrolase n=1 Tax=Bordetella genomosp. 11 TaxID=1416808 RepID=A0A261UFC5_9BORD|nr:N-acyl homoserine lactonase family protein [Bordetella genomosp. 11]OZI59583.1 MBL fold hydrolase [Bordetella genomosp. 11]
MLPEYEVFAIKYGEHQRTASANFLGGDPHNGPMPMDYFVWLIRDAGRTWVVDAGFDADEARARGRKLIHPMRDAMKLMDVDVDAVRDLIVTHMHYDHIGNLAAYPNAVFHLQDREMEYATGRYMAHRCMAEAFNLRDVLQMVEQVYAGRVRFHDGDAEIAPGITVHRIGGHTKGLQVVRVHTARGWVVLASDASHYYRNMEEGRPFPAVLNVGDMLEGHRRLDTLADSHAHIVPGHDPQVLLRYPPPAPALAGKVAVLHVPPSQ